MADPLDIVERIIGFALKIKEEAETAKQNEVECRGIDQRAAMVRAVCGAAQRVRGDEGPGAGKVRCRGARRQQIHRRSYIVRLEFKGDVAA
ncbi:unnamed protein product [Urochloa humidicola]